MAFSYRNSSVSDTQKSTLPPKTRVVTIEEWSFFNQTWWLHYRTLEFDHQQTSKNDEVTKEILGLTINMIEPYTQYGGLTIEISDSTLKKNVV